MAGVALENWVERIRDPKIECMSRDEMAALQSERLVDVVKESMKMCLSTAGKCSRGAWSPGISDL